MSNKRGASISVVDPATRTVVRTLALPRASQPFGVAMSPTAAVAFVALEAGGQVLRFDTASYAQTGALQAGLNLRQLSVSADGALVYASRFITPPLPGEATSVVTTPATAGAQVLEINAATMTLARTWVLAHGNAEDGENQGRGVPNYLGAAVISPDGTQALVPGKQFFYDDRDTRLARDSYMSCASCHNDGGNDGRTWDLTHVGEGLRNTISLRGRAGAQGRLHWSGNFDEVQDFEAQIRTLAGGTGLMSNAQFNAGTRSQPLGDAKAGISADLDALAAYVTSLGAFDPSPARTAAGALTSAAVAGKAVFAAQCASCHEGAAFTDSAKRVLHQVGTQNASSGNRLFQPLNGLDAPTLRDVWATAPYLHSGSAATIEAAVRAHTGIALSAADLASVVAYTGQIGAEETAAPPSTANLVVRALATLTDQVGALFEVRVNSAVVGAGQLDATGWVDLFFNVVTLVKDALIEVVFKNDASNATEDRNLAVQTVRVNGSATLAATAPGGVIDPGSGAAAFDGVGAVPSASTGGWLPWDGALRLRAPDTGGGGTVTVRGSATLAAGVGSTLELYINGVRVASRTVTNTMVQNLNFSTPPIAAGDRIDVVFSNDLFVNGEDRNLFVESVTARGTVLASTATGVVLDAGTGAAAFDGVDVFPGGQFGGWIPWNAAMRFVAR